MGSYVGAVCYQNGWHHAVVTTPAGDEPGARLVREPDGTFREATDADTESHFDRYHGQFVTVVPDDGSGEPVRVNAEQYQQLLALIQEKTDA